MTAEGKELQNLAKVQHLLAAVERPKVVSVVHIPGPQSANTPEAVGNHQADAEAKRVAETIRDPKNGEGEAIMVAAMDLLYQNSKHCRCSLNKPLKI